MLENVLHKFFGTVLELSIDALLVGEILTADIQRLGSVTLL